MSRTLAITLIVMAAMVAGFFVLSERDSEHTSLQPAENSAANRSSPVSAGAEANSAPESTRELSDVVKPSQNSSSIAASLDTRTLVICHSALAQQRNMERVNCDALRPEDSAGQNLCRTQQAAVAKRLEGVTANTASCPPQLLNSSEYYKALRAIALTGDVKAQRCFIQGRFNDPDRGERISEEEMKEYVILARKFIDAGLERGDWSLVQWLGRIRVEIGDALLGQAYPIGQSNPETIYKMKYLLTQGEQAKTQSEDPRKVVDAWQHNNILSDEQLRKAEEWARTMYAQHFVGSKEGIDIPVHEFCGSE